MLVVWGAAANAAGLVRVALSHGLRIRGLRYWEQVCSLSVDLDQSSLAVDGVAIEPGESVIWLAPPSFLHKESIEPSDVDFCWAEWHAALVAALTALRCRIPNHRHLLFSHHAAQNPYIFRRTVSSILGWHPGLAPNSALISRQWHFVSRLGVQSYPASNTVPSSFGCDHKYEALFQFLVQHNLDYVILETIARAASVELERVHISLPHYAPASLVRDFLVLYQ
jgi:hypothetical protein